MENRFKFISYKIENEYFFDVYIDGVKGGTIDMVGYDCSTSILDTLKEPYDLISG